MSRVVVIAAVEGELPHISPDGYNASLYGSEVELRCLLPSDTSIFLWLIDGNSSVEIGEAALSEQGIRYDSTLYTEGAGKYTVIFIEPRAENNDTVVQCIAYLNSPPYVQESNEILFRVQGEEIVVF